MNALNVKLLTDHMGDVEVDEGHIDNALSQLGVAVDKTATFDEKFAAISTKTVALIADSSKQIVTWVKL